MFPEAKNYGNISQLSEKYPIITDYACNYVVLLYLKQY